MNEPIFESFEEGWEYNGIQKGIQQGIQQGRLAADRDRLKQHLGRRFGPLPRELAQRVDGADAVSLDRWFDRSYDANALDELFEH